MVGDIRPKPKNVVLTFAPDSKTLKCQPNIMLIQHHHQVMRVVGVTGDVLTVARAAAGSVAASHASGARATLVAGASLTANALSSDGALSLSGATRAGIVNASFVLIEDEILQVLHPFLSPPPPLSISQTCFSRTVFLSPTSISFCVFLSLSVSR